MVDSITNTPSDSRISVQIPQIEGEPCPLEIFAGETLFIVGANGTGKSSLLQFIYNSDPKAIHWISSLRATTFQQGSHILHAFEKNDHEEQLRREQQRPDARWRRSRSSAAPVLIFTNLFSRTQSRNNEIARCVDNRDTVSAANYSANNKSPIEIINKIFKQSNLPICLELQENGEIIAQKGKGEKYSSAMLSDGERNILLMTSEVLTTTSNIVMIDEPERHLHTSIIVPFIKALATERDDCVFIISTHHIALASSDLDSKTLVVRNCQYEKNKAIKWDTDLIINREIHEEILEDILGARRKILFVEGENTSMDKRLYELIFPSVSIVPKQSYKNVESAVTNTRELEQYHRIKAYGIIDRDMRVEQTVSELENNGTYALNAYSVESIYYDSKILSEVAKRIAQVDGADVDAILTDARNAACEEASNQAEALGKRMAEHDVRGGINDQIPKRDKMFDKPILIKSDPNTILKSKITELQKKIQDGDLDYIITNYPVRCTPILTKLTQKLQVTRKKYEDIALQTFRENPQLVEYVREKFFARLQVVINS